MKTVPRHKLTQSTYREILDIETNHNHEIIEDDGIFRWKYNPSVRKLVNKIGLNDIIMLMHSLGYNKNSEPYRKLYRDIGYSLFGYWEIFYWEVNNDDVDKYLPSVMIPVKDLAKKLRHKKV